MEEHFWDLMSFPTPGWDGSHPPFHQKQRRAFHLSRYGSGGITETSCIQFSSYSWEEEESGPLLPHAFTFLCMLLHLLISKNSKVSVV